MTQKLALRTKKDEIYEGLLHLANQINLMRRLYPKAMKEIFLSNNIEISKPYSWEKKKYKKKEIKSLVMANLEIDLLKNSYDNN